MARSGGCGADGRLRFGFDPAGGHRPCIMFVALGRMRGMVTEAATTPDEIDELARLAQGGNRDPMEALLTAVRPRTLNVCRGVLPYSPDAEVKRHYCQAGRTSNSLISADADLQPFDLNACAKDTGARGIKYPTIELALRTAI